MVQAEEIREAKNTMEFTLPLMDKENAQPRARVATNGAVAVAMPSLETNGILLSGTQVFWSCVSALTFVGLFLWAVLKLWVYE